MSHKKELSPEALQIFRKQALDNGLDAATIERIDSILFFFTHQCSVSETCRQFGVSRSTFHRWMDRLDLSDIFSLSDRLNPSAFTAEVEISEGIIDLIREIRKTTQYIGKEKISLMLEQQYGLSLSASTIGRIIERECLYFGSTPFHQKKQMMARQKKLTSYSSQQKEQAEEQKKPTIIISPNNEEGNKKILTNDSDHLCVSFAIPTRSWKRFALIFSVMANAVVLLALVSAAMMESSSDPDINEINQALHASPSDTPHNPW